MKTMHFLLEFITVAQLNAFGHSLVEKRFKSKLTSVLPPFLKWLAFLEISLYFSSFSLSFKNFFLPLENLGNHRGN